MCNKLNYEKPIIEKVIFEVRDVITLSVNDSYDPTIGGDDNNPWK